MSDSLDLTVDCEFCLLAGDAGNIECRTGVQTTVLWIHAEDTQTAILSNNIMWICHRDSLVACNEDEKIIQFISDQMNRNKYRTMFPKKNPLG